MTSLSITFRLTNTNTSHTDISFHTTPSCSYAHIRTESSKHSEHSLPPPPVSCSKGATNNEKETWFLALSSETYLWQPLVVTFNLGHAHPGQTLSLRPAGMYCNALERGRGWQAQFMSQIQSPGLFYKWSFMEHSLMHSFLYCLWMFFAGWENYDQDYMFHKTSNIYCLVLSRSLCV